MTSFRAFAYLCRAAAEASSASAVKEPAAAAAAESALTAAAEDEELEAATPPPSTASNAVTDGLSQRQPQELHPVISVASAESAEEQAGAGLPDSLEDRELRPADAAPSPLNDVPRDEAALPAVRGTGADPAVDAAESPRSAEPAADQPDHEDRAQAAEAAFARDVAALGPNQTAGSDPRSAAVSVAIDAAQMSRTLGDFASERGSTVSTEAEGAQRAFHVAVDSMDEVVQDPRAAVTAEPGPLEQGLSMARHMPNIEAVPVNFDSTEQPVTEPVSPPGRTSASDLIAAMVQQAEEQEAAARQAVAVTDGVSSTNDTQHATLSDDTQAEGSLADGRVSQVDSADEQRTEQSLNQQLAQEQSITDMLGVEQ